MLLLLQAVIALAISGDSQLLASASKDGKVKVWRLATGECVRRFAKSHGDGGAASLAFSRDGMQLLSGGFDGVVRRVSRRRRPCHAMPC